MADSGGFGGWLRGLLGANGPDSGGRRSDVPYENQDSLLSDAITWLSGQNDRINESVELASTEEVPGLLPAGYLEAMNTSGQGTEAFLQAQQESNRQALVDTFGQDYLDFEEQAQGTVLDSWEYVIQAPLTDALVVMSRAFLDAEGTEQEAAQAALQAGREYLGEEGWNYLLPWLERPELRSFVEDVPELGPTVGTIADLLSGAVGVADWAFDAGRVINAAQRLRPQNVLALSSELRQMAALPRATPSGVTPRAPMAMDPRRATLDSDRIFNYVEQRNFDVSSTPGFTPEFGREFSEALGAGEFDGKTRREAMMLIAEIQDRAHPYNSQGMRQIGVPELESNAGTASALLEEMGLPTAQQMQMPIVVVQDGIFTPGDPAVARTVQMPDGTEARELVPVFHYTTAAPADAGFQRFNLDPANRPRGAGGFGHHGAGTIWFAEDPQVAAAASIHSPDANFSTASLDAARQGASDADVAAGTRAFQAPVSTGASIRPQYLTIEKPFDMEALPPQEVLNDLARIANDQGLDFSVIETPALRGVRENYGVSLDPFELESFGARLSGPNGEMVKAELIDASRELEIAADAAKSAYNNNMAPSVIRDLEDEYELAVERYTWSLGNAGLPSVDDAINIMDANSLYRPGITAIDTDGVMALQSAIMDIVLDDKPSVMLRNNAIEGADAIAFRIQHAINEGNTGMHSSRFHEADGGYGWLRDEVFDGNPDALNAYLQDGWGYDSLTANSMELPHQGYLPTAGTTSRVYAVLNPDRILNFDDIEGALARAVQNGSVIEGSPEWQQWQQLISDRASTGIADRSLQDWLDIDARAKSGRDMGLGTPTKAAPGVP